MNNGIRAFSGQFAQFAVALLLTSLLVCVCQAEALPTEEAINRIAWGERELVAALGTFLFEVYAQRANGEGIVEGDEHRFGRGGIYSDGVFVSEFVPPSQRPKGSSLPHKSPLLTDGFVQMIVPDSAGVDPDHYDWKYKGHELLGAVRCWVFDLKPKKGAGHGDFVGRIWVADKDLAIVRFDGTYTGAPRKASPYFHFISCRVKCGPGLWLPAAVYVEEKDLTRTIDGSSMFKARVSIWGYHAQAHSGNESTSIRIPEGQDLTVSKDSHII